jgi:hypothetical protein
MTHTIVVTIEEGEDPRPEFQCHEPDTAWCRRKLLADKPDAPPTLCWFTLQVPMILPWGYYDGPPTELRCGEIEVIKLDSPEYLKDFCCWHYASDDALVMGNAQ